MKKLIIVIAALLIPSMAWADICPHAELKADPAWNDKIIAQYIRNPQSIDTDCFRQYVARLAKGTRESMSEKEWNLRVENFEQRVAKAMRTVFGDYGVFSCPDWYFRMMPNRAWTKAEGERTGKMPIEVRFGVADAHKKDGCHEVTDWEGGAADIAYLLEQVSRDPEALKRIDRAILKKRRQD